MEYVGQLIDEKEALRREALYRTVDCGSYMFFFEHNSKTHWYVSRLAAFVSCMPPLHTELPVCSIDATAELPTYGNGRLLSHSRANPNLKPEKVVIDGVPRLCLVALHFIPAGSELQYDYGERDAETLKHFSWLATT
jgi:SET domain-containing protein